MKKYEILIVFLVVLFVLSCGPRNQPAAINLSSNTQTPISTAGNAMAIITPTFTPTPPAAPCSAGPITYTSININYIPCTTTSNSIIVVNSQADFNALCMNSVATIAGTPTPTPVAIDFSTKTLIIMGIPYLCCGSVYTNSLVNITTDCSTITMNWLATPSSLFCRGIYCNAMCDIMLYYYYLINKTYLPVTQSWTTLSCPTPVPTP